MPITPPIFLSQLDLIEKRGSRLIRWANLGGLSSHFIWNSVLAFFLPRCPIVLYYHLKMFLLPFHHKSTEFPLNNVSISRLRLQRWIPWAGYSWFSLDVTKIQTTKLSILLRFCFHDVLEQLKTNVHINFRFKKVLGFYVRVRLNF